MGMIQCAVALFQLAPLGVETQVAVGDTWPLQALTPPRAKALDWQFSKREAHCSGQVEA